MYKNFIIVLFLVFSLSLFSTEASNKNRIKADEFFIKGEWIEASEIYNTLIVMNKGDISLYAPSIISAGKNSNYERALRYITLAEKNGISLDSVFCNTLSLSIKRRCTDVYENLLITLKERQPRLKKIIDIYLLDFYFDRKKNLKTIEIADIIIKSKPSNIAEIMIIKAKALNDMGDINSAINVMKEVFDIDSNNIEARLYLGNYYYFSAKESIKNGNFTVKTEEKKGKKGENVKYINTDIYSALKRARFYLDVNSLTNKRPYVQNIIKEIEALIEAFENPME